MGSQERADKIWNGGERNEEEGGIKKRLKEEEEERQKKNLFSVIRRGCAHPLPSYGCRGRERRNSSQENPQKESSERILR